MNPVIQTENLACRYGKRAAVRDLTFTVESGSIFALIGRNGAGKSTTIKTLMNILTPASGRAVVLGTDSRRLGPPEFQKIGYISENQELPEWMTVEQLIEYCSPMYPGWDAAFCEYLKQQLHVPTRQRIRELSRGARMKVALLLSLAYKPQLLVLDEPFAGLDAWVREELIKGVLELAEQDRWSVLISSQDIDEVQQLADHIAILDDGQLVLSESTEHLLGRFRRIEVTIAEKAVAPEPLPDSWIHPQSSEHRFCFICTDFREGKTEEQVRSVFPEAKHIALTKVDLQEITLAIGRSRSSQSAEAPQCE